MPAEPMTINDAIDALNNAAKRQRIDKDAAERFSAAKTKTVLGKNADAAFFASLALSLDYKPKHGLGTAATDGRAIFYDPVYVTDIKPLEVDGLLIHEIMHNANGHFRRLIGSDPTTKNIAFDLAINPLIRAAGYQLPPGGLFPGEGEYADLAPGLSAEEYYAALQQKQQEQPQSASGGDGQPSDGDGDGDGQPGNGPAVDPGKSGGVIEPTDDAGNPLDEAQQKQLEAEWKVKIAAAAQAAKRRGTLSAGLERIIGEALAPVVNWKEALREFITRNAKRNYNWKRPNRRHIHAGLYLPSLHSLELGDIVVAVDTSGSITPETLQRFAGEIADIAAQGANKITTLYHDSDVVKVETWTPDDGPFTLTPCGGGGTDHKPVFDWIEQNADEPPTVLICLTDLASAFPSAAPEYPVLWASTDKRARHPFGERLDIEEAA